MSSSLSIEGKDFCIRFWTLTVSLFSSSLEVWRIPAESWERRLAVIFMSNTAMAVVTKSRSKRMEAVHWTASAMGPGTMRNRPQSRGLAASMVSSARAPQSRA